MACPPAVPERCGAGGKPAVPAGLLSEQMQLFGRRLQDRGLSVTTGGLRDALRSLACIGLGRRDDFRTALETNLVCHKEDLTLFDQEFDRFWGLLDKGDGRGLPLQAIAAADGTGASGEEPTGTQAKQKAAGALYSRNERLAEKDFKDWAASDWPEASAWLHHWVQPFLIRITRRYEPGQGHLLEIRKTLRASLRTGGDPLDLAFRKRRTKPRPLIILADVSGSMEPYARFFFLFVRAWMRLPLPVEIFAFSTRLTRLTPWIRSRDWEEVLETMRQRVPQWSGGTRIGESLELFLKEFSNKLPGRRSLVVIFSDGWDLGDPVRLREALTRLKGRCHKLLWLNPLMGSPEYQPVCQGMAAALPFVDRLLPIHNVSALNRMACTLEALLSPKSSPVAY